MEGPCSPLPNTAPHRHRLPPHYFSLCCMEEGEPKGRGELIQLHSSKRGSRWQPKPAEADSSCMPQQVLSLPPAPALTTAVWQRSMTLKQNVFFFFFLAVHVTCFPSWMCVFPRPCTWPCLCWSRGCLVFLTFPGE